MKISYYSENQYGIERLYPVSKDAVMVCKLMGTVTLTDHAMNVLRDNNATFRHVLKGSAVYSLPF